MDSGNLQDLFAQQQRRREAGMAKLVVHAPAARKTNQKVSYLSRAISTVALVVFVASATLTLILKNTVVPLSDPALLQVTQPARVVVVTATATEIHFVIERQVCTDVPAGYLNVRFAPGTGSSVRGYLAEGEAIQLSTNRITGDIEVQDRGDGTPWIRLQSPIEGWVNARYICLIEGKKHNDQTR